MNASPQPLAQKSVVDYIVATHLSESIAKAKIMKLFILLAGLLLASTPALANTDAYYKQAADTFCYYMRQGHSAESAMKLMVRKIGIAPGANGVGLANKLSNACPEFFD